MARSNMWYLDRTFKSRPLLFSQLYVIHYEYQRHVVPGVFVLMENRQEQTYADVLTVVQNELPVNMRQGPGNFAVNFELGGSNAFKQIFPESNEAYCFFHLSQSL